jgi:predicted HD superfamily hydrolase involved in NAD metabolism
MVEALPKLLKDRFKAGRFRHTQGVVRTALRLAKAHHVSVKKVATAAWLHDCGKALERSEMKGLLTLAKADEEERRNPPLWHAAVGAYLAQHEYGVSDREILKAIRYHSTGAPQMTPLQKILFVADYSEPGRPNWPELKLIRGLAPKNIDLAFFEVLRHKMMDLLQHGRAIHSRSVATYHDSLKSFL